MVIGYRSPFFNTIAINFDSTQDCLRRIVIGIRKINDDLKDFDRLFQIKQQASQEHSEIFLDFSKCYFLRQNAVAFLGGLIRLLQSQGKTVNIKWDTLHKNIATNLQQNGFMHVFNNDREPWEGNSIPYREDFNQDEDCLVDYLKEKWLGKGWINVGQDLQNLIVSRVYEIYANAFEHGQSNIGVFSCGQYYPNLGELKLTVVDFGVGIPSHVRNYQKNPNLSSDEALEWAFQPGKTTRLGEVTGGIGLDFLKQFVNLNQGKLEIFSHDGYAIIDKCNESYQVRQTFFEGTLVNITLKCDESYYYFECSSDLDDQPLF